jgi:hypothetical protein
MNRRLMDLEAQLDELDRLKHDEARIMQENENL